MIENLFLTMLAMIVLLGGFTIGFIVTTMIVLVKDGKQAAVEFIKKEF